MYIIHFAFNIPGRYKFVSGKITVESNNSFYFWKKETENINYKDNIIILDVKTFRTPDVIIMFRGEMIIDKVKPNGDIISKITEVKLKSKMKLPDQPVLFFTITDKEIKRNENILYRSEPTGFTSVF